MGSSGTHARSDSGLGSVVAIGVFDGVHRGHQALILRARAIADGRGLPLVALTFDPHPAAVVPGRQAPATLATLHERVDGLRAAGADEVVVLAFDEGVASMDPATFVDRVLIDQLHARAIVVGENFRFGRGATGDVTVLRSLGADRDIEVTAVPLHPADGPWSSSRVRRALDAGDVVDAQMVLGRPYRLAGVIVNGDHRGRELGYPTANLDWEGNPAIPQDGVYAGWLIPLDGGDAWPAAISVGTNPQFDGHQRRVEAYALDEVDLDLYGRPMAVDFVARLRGQMTFDSVDGLVDQMGRDVDQARELLMSPRATGFPGSAMG